MSDKNHAEGSKPTVQPDKQGRNKAFVEAQFKPGHSGNPRGRPRKHECLTSLLKEKIEKINPRDKEKRTWMELVVLATIKLAMKGHPAALREVWGRVDGKVR
jgi:uncharacterized protein DUF5681